MVSTKLVFPIFLLLLVACAERNSSIQFDFVDIPKGQYLLGDAESQVNPIHSVAIRSFQVSSTEVTNAQFKAFVDATAYITDAEKHKNAKTFYVGLGEFEWFEDSTANWRFPFGKENAGIEDRMDHPVTCISFHDALAFCKWARVRLPTLDEWEAAARAGTRETVYCGSIKQVSDHANIWLSTTHALLDVEDTVLFTAPVASYPANPWGLYDMYGNVFEFCAGKPAVFQNTPGIISARGGSWWCSKHSCSFFNSVDIGRVHEHASFANHGFRVVKL